MVPFSTQPGKILIQCDFDGTITEEDVSFVLLDAFTGGEWRPLLEDYRAGRISVGYLNREAFGMVKANRQDLVKAMSGRYKIRSGFQELVDYCHKEGLRFVIVSNGLDFYIDTILKELGLQGIEVFAAQTQFQPEGLRVRYIGPEGDELDEGFKEAHVDSFTGQGYRIFYAGNGASDFPPARKCYHIFATGELLSVCRKKNVECFAFDDLNEIITGLDLLL
jgi:2-hydroxy-3-keto-5-methylthiopentenyl-1-phosphate phosphatase